MAKVSTMVVLHTYMLPLLHRAEDCHDRPTSESLRSSDHQFDVNGIDVDSESLRQLNLSRMSYETTAYCIDDSIRRLVAKR